MTRRRPDSAGFTVIELMFSLAVVFLIMGIILGALRFATRGARSAADQTTVNSLKLAVDQFKKEFGFFPALVKDLNSPAPLAGTSPKVPVCYSSATPADLAYLRGDLLTPTTADLRFSIYAPAYYLMGALGAVVDGKDGPGFTTPSSDGSFSRKGRTFDPFFDSSRNAQALYFADDVQGRVELRDSTNTAFRYYRWLPDDATVNPMNQADPDRVKKFLNVPDIVGDPNLKEELRSATWAIVGAGRDGLFGDEWKLQPPGAPATHPQYVDINTMAARLSITGLTSPALEAAVEKKAAADNIVVVGGAK